VVESKGALPRYRTRTGQLPQLDEWILLSLGGEDSESAVSVEQPKSQDILIEGDGACQVGHLQLYRTEPGSRRQTEVLGWLPIATGLGWLGALGPAEYVLRGSAHMSPSSLQRTGPVCRLHTTIGSLKLTSNHFAGKALDPEPNRMEV
jgi:hypothetical protein